ncbi:UDP-glucose--hexose-1-phosphate uridylyltransferase [Salinicoccus sp. RF5]|uniref:UDP-glucose--hexose-1-phosphate uridylyltransferase n=1 Tax=Salinicoccus sp. RF5 TaxID=2748874 RepID=UPI001E654891|nr:UDP-glucose--hexose-1-phosphate uridylyltransferase [Salinicoccus sp. RF5]MCC4722334.1 UDP-glucose--hexose-1-phosphate uridylyltransferase [Salinicoccus sp. RF5]
MKKLIDQIIDQAIELELVEARDRTYLHNQMMGYIPEKLFFESEEVLKSDSNTLIEKIVERLAESKVIEDKVYVKDLTAANMMNLMIPKPSVIEERFHRLMQEGTVRATDDFYAISLFSNYIQKNRIRQNISFSSNSDKGPLELTINLSKPEKTTEEIREAQNNKKEDDDYPKCLLCKENEGYIGHINHPPRSNHRIVGIEMGGNEWYFQFSPYSYYSEHSIVFSKNHTPMKIGAHTFRNLTDFVDQFPHYFIGSNADLPIVGGSMLSHEHYQAGRHVFPIEKAPSFFEHEVNEVTYELLKWPLSTIRISGRNKEAVIRRSVEMTEAWKQYDNEALGILSHTDAPHNTVTPIVRKMKDKYHIYLILRNNRTTEERPEGLFHVDPEDFHIKRENIGLIEAMGLAVLPARLKQDAEELEASFKNGEKIDTVHDEWVEAWKKKYEANHIKENFEQVFKKELGLKFRKILEACGVFKDEKTFKVFFKEVTGD